MAFVILACIIIFLDVGLCSHFRGGVITWAPVYSQPNQITVTWRFAWKRDAFPDTFCDQLTIDNNGLIGEGDICNMGTATCFDARTYCNDFSEADNWSSGTFTTTFTVTSTSFVLQYYDCCWITLDNHGESSFYSIPYDYWDLRSYVDLSQRPDGKGINTSPTTSIAPVVYVTPNSENTFVIPVADADGDFVRCRWAEDEDGELVTIPDHVLTIDEDACTLTFTSSGSMWAVALFIEDFLTSASNTALSAVPVQFLIEIRALPQWCPREKPVLISPSPADGSEITAAVGELFTAEIRGNAAIASGTLSVPITHFVTISPRGLTKSSLMSEFNSNEKYITVSWTPELSQIGPQIFCFAAADECQSSDQWCVTLMVTVTCDPACINEGVCILPNECKCLTGYVGDHCQTAICDPSCQNGGECIRPNECTCQPGYTGSTCQQAVCVPSCEHDGECVAPDTCECTSDYIGDVCEIRNAPSITFVSENYFVDESDDVVNVSLTNTGPQPGTVVLQTVDVSATGDEDYYPLQNIAIEIQKYENHQVSIVINEDEQVEDNEVFYLEIRGAAVGEGITGTSISIADNDASIVFTEAHVISAESIGTTEIYVLNNGSVTGTVYISTSSVSASNNEDFEPISQLALIVDAGEIKPVPINILDDHLVESDEVFLLEMSGDDVGLTGFKTMDITINDNDASINFINATTVIIEPSGVIKLMLQNNGSVTGIVFMWTQGISAEEYSDYQPARNRMVTVSLQEPTEVSILIHDDTKIEAKESFLVFINGTSVGGGIRTVSVTIHDDDVFKSPVELFEERVAKAIVDIDELEFDESITNDEKMTQLEEISATIFDNVFEEFYNIFSADNDLVNGSEPVDGNDNNEGDSGDDIGDGGDIVGDNNGDAGDSGVGDNTNTGYDDVDNNIESDISDDEISAAEKAKAELQALDPIILAEASLDIIAAVSKHIPEEMDTDGDATSSENWIQINITRPGIDAIVKRVPEALVTNGFVWGFGYNTSDPPWVYIAQDVLDSLPAGEKTISIIYIDPRPINKTHNAHINVSGAEGPWEIVSGTLGVELQIDESKFSIPVSYGVPTQSPDCGGSSNSLAQNDVIDRLCSYWDTSISMYSVNGQAEIEDAYDDFCSCHTNHTTSFAVLMQFNGCPLPQKHARVLDRMTTAFLAISIISLFITICVFLSFETLRNMERYQIHLHLAATLMIAICVFLVGIDRTDNQTLCTVVAMALHYLFLSVFGWMLVEGLSLYFNIVVVYGAEKNRMPLYIGIGYGMPAAVVASSGAAKYADYISPTSCWLDVQSGLIWAFGAPAATIIAVNSVLLLLVGSVLFKAASAINDGSKTDGARASLKGTLILSPLLGTTWVFGYMSLTDAAIVFQYLFCICNSLQGFFIFMAYCTSNKEVQTHVKKAYERHWQNRITPLDNTSINATSETKMESLD